MRGVKTASEEHLLFWFTSCETGLCYGAQTGFEFEIPLCHWARVTNVDHCIWLISGQECSPHRDTWA